jgi:YfiH family protein
VRLPEPFFALGEHIGIDLPGARAVFTTRRGGVSAGPYESLNLGILTDDDPALVQANRRSLADAFGVSPAFVRQVHENRVQVITHAVPVGDDGAEPTAADGVATALPGCAPMVLAADCLPIAIAGGGAVAMVHAGWPGLAKGVVGAGLAAVREVGHVAPLVAAIGPGAGPCCYEVGDELRTRFAAYGDEVRRERNLDLKLIARRQLEAAGVSVVHDVGLCTICSNGSHPPPFFSHRRDRGVTGRQAGIAWLT